MKRIIATVLFVTFIVASWSYAEPFVKVTLTAADSAKSTYLLEFNIDQSLTDAQRATNATDDLVWITTSGKASTQTRLLLGGFNTRLRLSQRTEFIKGLQELTKASAKAKLTKRSGRLVKQIYDSKTIGRTFTLDITPSGEHYAIVSDGLNGQGLECQARFNVSGITPVLKLFSQLDKYYAQAVKESKL